MTQKVYVVGLGPGGIEQMTQRAKAALASAMLSLVITFISILLKRTLLIKNF